jgi:hypothetical protein
MKKAHNPLPREKRAALWQIIRKCKVVNDLATLARRAGVHVQTAENNISRWVAGGFMEPTTGGYKLIKDAVAAPRIGIDGRQITQENRQQRMWRVIRIRRRVTLNELVMYGSMEDSVIILRQAKTYGRYLECAGYLKRVGYRQKGWRYSFENAIFVLVRDTGLQAPQIISSKTGRSKQVYDPNLKAVVWPLGTNGDTDE